MRTAMHTAMHTPTGAMGRVGGGIALAATALFLFQASAPWPDTPDGLFHLQRVRSLAEALSGGVLFPRWFPDFAFAYGYPVLNFYAPAFYYPPALLHLAGLDLILAVRVSLALWYALSGWAVYGLLRRWVEAGPATLGALLYLAYPYRLYDLFVRGALPEFAAFLWPPLILWAVAGWLPRPALTDPRLILAALAWAGLILTHNLTALMAALAGGFLLLLWSSLPLLRRDGAGLGRRLATGSRGLLLPLALGGGLSGFYALPALAETGWVGLSAGGDGRGYAAHFAGLGDLFRPGWIYAYPDVAQATVAAPAYVPLLLLLAGGIVWLPLARRWRSGLALSAGMVLASLWLTTQSSHLLWDGLAPLLGKLQFPWRWQTLTALALAGLLALLAQVGWNRCSRPWRWAGGVLLAGALGIYGWAGVAGATVPAPFTSPDLTPAHMWAFDAQFGQVGASWTGEFLPRWVTEQRWAIGRESSQPEPSPLAAGLPGPAQVTVLAQNYLGETVRYTASAPVQLVYHTFFYPAWRLEVDGLAAQPRFLGDLGLLAVDLPPGQHTLARTWAATPAVWLGRGLTAAAGLALLGLLYTARLRRRWLWIGLWTGAALLAGTASANLWMVEQPVTPVGADFGDVRLEGAVARPAAPGGPAEVTLHWLAVEPGAALTAFVHLLGAEGQVVAGHDAPLAGDYTPASRWQPGQLLSHRHALALPADLPPGRYALMAGVYRPGQADAPLLPAGRTPGQDPRVPIGHLEVRP